jgi:hypothetical protein
MAISWIVFGVVFGGAILGMALRKLLPEEHLSQESKDVVKVGMGLIATMAALVLGLLIASAKGSYDTQRNGLAQLAGNVIVLDRALAHCGPESNDAREKLRESVDDMLRRTWPQEASEPVQTDGKSGTEGRYEIVYEKILELKPETDAQRAFQAQALKIAMDSSQSRWVLFAQKGSSVPTPFLIILVFWLAVLFASFSIFARPNATVFVALLLCALSVAGAIFLIQELDRPFGGFIQLSSEPVRRAREQLGQKESRVGRVESARPANPSGG